LSDDGLPLGTLCVVDNKPKLLSQSQITSLEALSNQVMNLMKLRKTNLKLEASLKELENKNEQLERFAFLAAHDIKSPLNNISNLTELFSMNHGRALGENARQMLEMISNSAIKLRSLVDGLLEYSRSDSILNEQQSNIDLNSLIHEIAELFTYENNLEIELVSEFESIHMNRAALEQILMNLIANAVKYSDKQKTEITFRLTQDPEFYYFEVRDNGPGIDPSFQDRIFEIFEIVASTDKFGIRGNGIGLATVKKLVLKLGGEVSVDSAKEKGANFKFSVAK
jgi:signal transduction histidine kinase